MSEIKKKCPECEKQKAPSWNVCLFCGDTSGDGYFSGWPRFPSRKGLIILFAILLMLLAPVVIFMLYTAYVGEMDLTFRRSEGKQLESAVYFDEEKEARQKKK